MAMNAWLSKILFMNESSISYRWSLMKPIIYNFILDLLKL